MSSNLTISSLPLSGACTIWVANQSKGCKLPSSGQAGAWYLENRIPKANIELAMTGSTKEEPEAKGQIRTLPDPGRRTKRKDDKRSSDWLSMKGRRADALALRADERRDKLRKAPVSRK